MNSQEVVMKTHAQKFETALAAGLCFAYGSGWGEKTPKVIGWAVSTMPNLNVRYRL